MSELNMNDLPREMLVKVFRLLDMVNLKNATLTCQLWNNLIESECRWSLKLDYSFLSGSWATRMDKTKINFIMQTNRKFGTVEIVMNHFVEGDQTHEILQRIGFNVVELNFRYCSVDSYSLDTIAKLLNLTQNVKQLRVDISIRKSVRSDAQLGQILPELKKLKSLHVCVDDQRIAQCFRKAKLREIKIWDNGFNHQGSWLVDFISSQDTMTSLIVNTRNKSPSILAELDKLNVPFRLTQLAFAGAIHDRDNLLRFVKSQAKNLRELGVGANFLSLVYECIIENMPKLKIVSVISDDMFPEIDFYKGLETNCSVRTVKLLKCDTFYGPRFQFLVKFLKKLPNVCSLILQRYSYTNEHPSDCVKFPMLETLHIQHLRDRIYWNELTRAHPLLTELIIEKMTKDSYLNNDDIDQITTNVDLHSIRLGVGFVADDRFFEIIRTKCTNLKVLDLHKSCLPEGLKDNVGTNVLRLCDDFGFSKTFRSLFD